MAGWIGWVRLEAPDRAAAEAAIAARVASPEIRVVRVQSEISFKIAEEELAALRQRRPREE